MRLVQVAESRKEGENPEEGFESLAGKTCRYTSRACTGAYGESHRVNAFTFALVGQPI